MPRTCFPAKRFSREPAFQPSLYWRPPAGDKPVLIFLPGGGHLARIAYGHPGANATDFIDHWLQAAGWGHLALSYPCDHPAFAKTYPDMTISDWGASSAAIALRLLADCPPPVKVVVAGWSMAGRAARAITRNLAVGGIHSIGFISLAASAPVPGLIPVNRLGEAVTREGLWNIAAEESGLPRRHAAWLAELGDQDADNGHIIISRADYERFYRVNTPLRLRGEPQFLRATGTSVGMAEALEELGTFDFAAHPLTAVIAPTRISDARHALTDHVTWGFLNAQHLFERHVRGRDLSGMSPDRWRRLREMMLELPQRLARTVEGGHFFFVGARGARGTVRQAIELTDDLLSVKAELSRLL